MHEKAILDDLMRKIVSISTERKVAKVTEVHVKLGSLCHMSPGHFREHFIDASRGTVAEGARVDAEVIPGITHPRARDIVLERLEVEEEEE